MIQPRSILGADYPFVACIETLFANETVTAGAGTLIGPRLVLTAGHVVFDPRHGGDGKPIRFRVTLGSSQRHSVTATRWRTTGPWMKKHSKLNKYHRSLSWADMGVVILNDPFEGEVAPKAITQTTTPVLNGLTLQVAGYSSDEQLLPNTAFYAESRGTVMEKVDHRITYPIATIPGMSGGPVWSDDGVVRAIHTSIFQGAGNALRIIEPLENLINKWLQKYAATDA